MSSTTNPTHGMKVKDPNAAESSENPGFVASDSLAAESSDFQSMNKNSQPLGVSGSNSTFANTDTSGADTLAPTKDAQSRQDDSGTYEQSKGTAVNSSTASKTTGGSGGSTGEAPSYVSSQYIDTSGPKGQNLKEGGFDSNDKNASFNQEIGTKNDPGRLAEQSFAAANADTGGMAGMPKQGGVGDENPYDALKSE